MTEKTSTLREGYRKEIKVREVNTTVKEFLECFTKEEIIEALASLRDGTPVEQITLYCDLFGRKTDELLTRMSQNSEKTAEIKTVAELCENRKEWEKINKQLDRLHDRFDKLNVL